MAPFSSSTKCISCITEIRKSQSKVTNYQEIVATVTPIVQSALLLLQKYDKEAAKFLFIAMHLVFIARNMQRNPDDSWHSSRETIRFCAVWWQRPLVRKGAVLEEASITHAEQPIWSIYALFQVEQRHRDVGPLSIAHTPLP